VPAPAVIPAPIAYIKVAAVKKLVVGFECFGPVRPLPRVVRRPPSTKSWAASAVTRSSGFGARCGPSASTTQVYTWSKLGCSKRAAQQSALNRSAWDVVRHPCAQHGREPPSGPPGGIPSSCCLLASAKVSGGFLQWERSMRTVGDVGIWPSEVKFLDRPKTIISESIRQVCPSQSRTKVGGSKMIRYRRSPDCKRCQPGIGRRRMDGPPGTPGET